MKQEERRGFLCGPDRDELEYSNVRETTNSHLPFSQARAYAGKRRIVGGIGRVRGGGATSRRDVGDKGSRARQRT